MDCRLSNVQVKNGQRIEFFAEDLRIALEPVNDLAISGHKALAPTGGFCLLMKLKNLRSLKLRHGNSVFLRNSVAGAHDRFLCSSNCLCLSSISLNTSSAGTPSSSGSVYFCKSAAVNASRARR
jgi:hypothetical protein